MSNRKIEYWVIPPEADSEFVAQMKEVLDVYARPYDASCPVICMDEQPIQLQKEIARPIEATAKHPKRVDYDYERAGTASIFMFTELLSWRQATVRQRRTKVDWAIEVAALINNTQRGVDWQMKVEDAKCKLTFPSTLKLSFDAALGHTLALRCV